MQDKCILNGCNRDIYVKKHRLCVTHYCRFIRTGEVGSVEIAPRNWRKPFDPEEINKNYEQITA